MSGLLPDDQTRNKEADKPWTKGDSSKLWNKYLVGAHPKRIAVELGRTKKAVLRRIEQLTYNEFDLAVRYVPFRRISRKGLRLTENEKLIIAAHKDRDVPVEATARLLCRDVTELNDDWKQVPAAKADGQTIKSTVDLILAHRYIFHVYKWRVISDKSYDMLFKEEVEYGGGKRALTEMSKHGFWGPHRIKTLALYLTERYEDEHGKPPPKRTDVK